MRRWLTVLLVLAAAILLLRLIGPDGDLGDVARPGGNPEAMAIERAARDPGIAPGGERARREPVAAAGDGPAPSREWTVQLRGIDPAVPWTAPLQLVFQDRFDVLGQVDAGGAFRFLPPENARLPGISQLHVVAADPHYRIANSRQPTVYLQQTGRQEFAVYPIASLCGRVIGPDGAGIAARVSAFLCEDGAPRAPLVARTDAAADGSYRLRVPPGTPVFVLAEAVWADVSSVLPVAEESIVFRHLRVQSPDDLEPDRRQPRDDLLPAGLCAEGSHHAERVLPDLRLGPGALVTGRVTLADGRACLAARVRATPIQPSQRWWQHRYWSPGVGLVAGAEATTDAHGQFALRLPPGVAYRVEAWPAEPSPAVCTQVTTMAPDDVVLVVAGAPLTLRAVAAGAPAGAALFDVGDATFAADRTGEKTFVLGPDPVRVRARDDTRESPWVELPAGARPSLLTLDLAPLALAEVCIRLCGSPLLREAAFDWQPLPAGPVRHRIAARIRDDEPFVMHVPPGRYRLTVRDRDDAPGGAYLLPLQFDLAVPPSGFAGEYDASFGGRLVLDVLDANGVRATGTFRLFDAAGRDVTPPAMAWSESGELHRGPPGVLSPFHTNQLVPVLPPGDYVLTVQGTRRSARQTIALRSGVTTTASLQLR